MSLILGMNDPWHDSSYCLLSPQRFVHVEMERFTRTKYEQINPLIGFISLHHNEIQNIDAVGVEEGMFVSPYIKKLLDDGKPGIEEFLEKIFSQNIGSIKIANCPTKQESGKLFQFAEKLLTLRDSVRFYSHHLCHAANAFYSSGFDNALSITLDGGGLEVINGDRITVHGSVFDFSKYSKRVPVPIQLEMENSIGFAWNRIRKILGLNWGEEGTVMAMAAFGMPSSKIESFIDNKLLWLPNEAELSNDLRLEIESFYKEFSKIIVSEDDRFAIAAALQKATELRVERFLRNFLANYSGDVCLSGGVFLNCQITGKIRKWFPSIKNIFIPPVPYDGGISIGAAQLSAYEMMRKSYFIPREKSLGNSSLQSNGFAPFAMGETYSRIDVVGAIRSHGCEVQDVQINDIIELLRHGAIIALFVGAAESGRRALGHRSIIADPREPNIKNKINDSIKHRQRFRPFAPMILAEHAAEWFEVDPQFNSPYMSFAVKVKNEKKDMIPAVVHHDGTARVQTVHHDLSPKIYELLNAWNTISGIPILLNTSLNDKEPIVQTPADAMSTFIRVPLDALYFADYGILVNKTEHVKI